MDGYNPAGYRALAAAVVELAEAEGLKVYLCIDHHREGQQAVHRCRETRELLCRIAQEEYEQTHTHEQWMELAGKNYL